MGNLGWYQLLTTMAKKVGGPKRLIGLFVGSGALAGGGIVAGGNYVKNKINSALEKKKQDAASAKEYTVKTEGKSNEGVLFRIGDVFKVLEMDGDVGLVEKVGDKNSPYYVSLRFLSSISDYQIA